MAPHCGIQDLIKAFSRDLQDLDFFCDGETVVKKLASSGLIHDWLNSELTALAVDQTHIGDWSLNEFVLHKDSKCSLSVSIFVNSQRYIHSLPFLGIYAPLSCPLQADRYELPPDFRNDVFDPSVRIVPAGRIEVAPAEVIRIESHRYLYDWRIAAPTPVLRLCTAPSRPLEWLFSRSTLQAWQANDATLDFTQLRVAANVLGKIAHQSSIGPLRKLSMHPHHAVRWSAIQNLGRVNRSEALIQINKALSDEHPHVRRAAQKTLAKLQGAQ